MLLGLAALTRNEAIWLALTLAIVAWSNGSTGRASRRTRRPATPSRAPADRIRAWVPLVAVPAVVAILVFAPWAYRDWVAFGSPFPGQALTNALSLQGTDIFAWQDRPTLDRYLDAGLPRLLELRWVGIVHNVVTVLLLLGVPLSIVGLIGLPSRRRWRHAGRALRHLVDPLRPLLLFSILTFLVASLRLPGRDDLGHVPARRRLDPRAARASRRCSCSTDSSAGRPPARLDAPGRVARAGLRDRRARLLFSAVLLPGDGRLARGRGIGTRPSPRRSEDPSVAMRLSAEPGPVITDFPIWFAEATRHHAIALPQEPIDCILDLARSVRPARATARRRGRQPGHLPVDHPRRRPRRECFVPLSVPDPPAHPGGADGVLAFRIRC